MNQNIFIVCLDLNCRLRSIQLSIVGWLWSH